MKQFKKELETHCELHWWNMGTKTLSFEGELKDLLKNQNITYTKRKTATEGIYTFTFKNPHGITFKATGLTHDFAHLAKQFIQMELVRMGDKSKLRVDCSWRPTVSVNF
jgi:hypothetical protein